MEELKKLLDPESLRKLQEAQVTDCSLWMLNEQDVIDLEIALGPRKIIRNVINNMSSPSTSYATSTINKDRSPSTSYATDSKAFVHNQASSSSRTYGHEKSSESANIIRSVDGTMLSPSTTHDTNAINKMCSPSTSYGAHSKAVVHNHASSASRTHDHENSSESSSDRRNNTLTIPTPSAQNVRVTLEREKSFRGILYNKLLVNIIPQRKEICKMVYILCESRFHDNMFVEKRNPTLQEKQQLAKDILEAFPHLKATSPIAVAPPEE